MDLAAGQLVAMDDGHPLVILAGVHVGCYQLFGTNGVRTVRDLKGKTVAVPALGSGPHLLLSIIAANIGLDPRKDITWVDASRRGVDRPSSPRARSTPSWASRRSPRSCAPRRSGTSWSTPPPTSRGLSTSAAWWPRTGSSSRKHPVATKRALRAILKATDVCAREPARAAQFLVDKGYAHALRLRPADAAGRQLHEVARVQPRGHGALLRPPPPRGSG